MQDFGKLISLKKAKFCIQDFLKLKSWSQPKNEKSAKILNSGFWKTKTFKSAKILN